MFKIQMNGIKAVLCVFFLPYSLFMLPADRLRLRQLNR